MKVWITKYLFTLGILEADGELDNDEQAIRIEKNEGGERFFTYIERGEWHASLAEAHSRAIGMVQCERAALNEQYKKLQEVEVAITATAPKRWP